MAKPNYTGLAVLASQNEIVKNLWQGVRPASYEGFDLVVSCEEFLAKKPMEGYRGTTIHLPLIDDDALPLEKYEIAIDATANAAIHVWMCGGRVLIHCSGGLNRSSLVTVEVLVGMGHTRRDAVKLLRLQRGEFCLCNRAFERWALREFLPTAETSAFHIDK